MKSRKTAQRTKWRYLNDGRPVALVVRGSMTVDTADALPEAALYGGGIAHSMDFAVGDSVRRGALA